MTAPFAHPDFAAARFAGAPDARFLPAPADGVLPEGFFSTTNLPTYVRVGGVWRMPREPRMDSALVLDGAGALWVREGRRVRAGELVAVGHAEDGREGIFVHAAAFLSAGALVAALGTRELFVFAGTGALIVWALSALALRGLWDDDPGGRPPQQAPADAGEPAEARAG